MKCCFTVVTAAVAVLGFACTSRAYEYHLQSFSSYAPCTNACNLSRPVVTGEQLNFDANGNLIGASGVNNYWVQSCGRYFCGPKTYSCYDATWDAQGNLVSSTLVSQSTSPCAALPTPAGTNGTEAIYASSGASTTGHDSYGQGFGFLSTPAPHFTCTANCNTYFDISDVPFYFSLALQSDGDFPVNITSTVASLYHKDIYTQGNGTVTVTGDCLSGPVAPGSSCTLTVEYDPTTITCTSSPYGFGYQWLTLMVVSDAGNLPEHTYGFTISGAPRCGGEE